MSFASFEFLAFLAILTLVYFIVPKKVQWIVLLLGSVVFYAFAGLVSFFFLFFAIVISFITVQVLGKRHAALKKYLEDTKDTLTKDERKAYRAKHKNGSLLIVCIGILLLTLSLVYVKYLSGFSFKNGVSFGSGAISFGSTLLEVMGISYYTFISIGYMIDVYREKAAVEKNFFRHALFVSFFPQLAMGPISRYADTGEQLKTPHSFEAKEAWCGLLRILWGFFKKLVVADAIAPAIGAIVGKQLGGIYFILLCLFYSIRIYGDFTGGIDIVLGAAQILGIKLPENFNRPFSSKSTAEYWNRWHMTMGNWFTNYIFYPLSLTKTMQKLSKWGRAKLGVGVGKRLPVYTATIITWLATGLWHGIAWNFVVWGLLNGVVILISQELNPLYEKFRAKFPKLWNSAPYQSFMAIRTFLLMSLIRVFDCYCDVPLTFNRFFSIFYTFNIADIWNGGIMNIKVTATQYIIIAVGIVIMTAVSRLSIKRPLRETLWEKPILGNAVLALLCIAILVFGSYGLGFDASAFIYGGTFN
ncbi:MAG: MBOAT family protein [Clostridia bacterium]|nr:MBOAT family protein [Clostridia bacterium]